MKLIIGLGNPGKAYEDSRHNIGFSAVKSLAGAYRINLKKDNLNFALTGKGSIEGQSVILSLPRTFMNLSGGSVRPLLKKHKIALDDALVIYDDLDLDFGRIRVTSGGSSGGHKGLKSIMDALDSRDFWRLRIGIGRPPPGLGASEYVLSPFAKKEKKQISQILEGAVEVALDWLREKTATTINIFSPRSRNE